MMFQGHLTKQMFTLGWSVGLLWCFAGPATVGAYEAKTDQPTFSHQTLTQLDGLEVQEKLSQKIDLQRTFIDENGQTVPLQNFFDGHRPVLMTMVYYSCPSLCNYHLNGLVETLKKLPGFLGREFQMVAVSMNHREDSDLAAAKKENYLKALGQPNVEGSWHFLTGTEANVGALANELGFRFRWDEVGQQYAHSAVAYVVTPQGVISRYLYGIEFSPQTLRLSLIEAAQGKVGNLVDQIMLFCFQFNPAKNKYTLYAYNIMRVGAVLTAILLAIFLVPVWLRERGRRGLAS
jgi:protein SCO1